MKKSLALILTLIITLTALSLASCGKEEGAPGTAEATTDAAVTTEATPSYENYPEKIVGTWTMATNLSDFMGMVNPSIADTYAQYGIDPADYEINWYYEFGANERLKISLDEETLKEYYLKLLTDVYENAKASGNYTDEVLENLKECATKEFSDALVDSLFGQVKEIEKTDTFKYTLSKDQLMFSDSTIRISIDGDTMEFIELMSPLDNAPLYLKSFPVTLTKDK